MSPASPSDTPDMATSARPLRLPPSVLAPSHARPRSARPHLVPIDPASAALPARIDVRGGDLPGRAEWLDDAFPRRAARDVRVPRALATAVAFNLGLAAVALAWALPSPWGGLVPLALLAQGVAWRQGMRAAITSLVASTLLGAGIGSAVGAVDWRRGALALSFVVLPALIAWPARRGSVRR